YYNPKSTTPNARTHNYTGTLADHLTIFGGVLESTFSVTHFDARVWAQGGHDLIITPVGNRGNYFAERDRDASRYSGSSSFAFGPLSRMGTHHFKLGAHAAASDNQGLVTEHPVEIWNSRDERVERISFLRTPGFQLADKEHAFFAQDHW